MTFLFESLSDLVEKLDICDKRSSELAKEISFFSSFLLPYQLVQVFVIDTCVHIGEITTHCHDYVVGTIELGLCLNITYELGDLRVDG